MKLSFVVLFVLATAAFAVGTRNLDFSRSSLRPTSTIRKKTAPCKKTFPSEYRSKTKTYCLGVEDTVLYASKLAVPYASELCPNELLLTYQEINWVENQHGDDDRFDAIVKNLLAKGKDKHDIGNALNAKYHLNYFPKDRSDTVPGILTLLLARDQEFVLDVVDEARNTLYIERAIHGRKIYALLFYLMMEEYEEIDLKSLIDLASLIEINDGLMLRMLFERFPQAVNVTDAMKNVKRVQNSRGQKVIEGARRKRAAILVDWGTKGIRGSNRSIWRYLGKLRDQEICVIDEPKEGPSRASFYTTRSQHPV